MPLTECPDCGHMVSDRAPICPECGYPFGELERRAMSRLWSRLSGGFALMTIVGLVILIFAGGEQRPWLTATGTSLLIVGTVAFLCARWRVWFPPRD